MQSGFANTWITRRSWTAIAVSLIVGMTPVIGCTSGNSEAVHPDGGDATASSGGDGPEPVKIQILAINDFHGNLEPPAGSGGKVLAGASDPIAAGDAGIPTDGGAPTKFVEAGGAAYLAAHVAALRAENPNTLLVGAGDLTGASPLVSALFHDEPTVLVMNEIGLDVTAVGNHEFDHGTSELLRLQMGGCHPTDGCPQGVSSFPGATYEYLAANVETRPEHTLFRSYVVREIAGEKIAIIGMTLEATPTVTSPSAVEGLVFDAEAATVSALMPELADQKVSAIVVLVHQGSFPKAGTTYDECNVNAGPIFDMAQALDPAVDVIVSAHTHQAYNCSNIGGKLVTSAASFGRVITAIQLSIDPKEHRVVGKAARNVAVTHDVEPAPEVSAIVEQYKTLAAPLANKVIGHVTADLTTASNAAGESVMGDIIADAQLAAMSAAATGGAQIAFMNPGGIRSDITFAPVGAEQAGEVTYAEAFASQPFSNALVTISLTGAKLKELLEQQFHDDGSATILQVSQGFSYTYDAAEPVGSRIDPASILLGGVAVDPAASYRIACNAFLAYGGDGFKVMAEGTDLVGGPIDLEALVTYFGAVDPLSPTLANRITKL